MTSSDTSFGSTHAKRASSVLRTRVRPVQDGDHDRQATPGQVRCGHVIGLEAVVSGLRDVNV